VVKPTIFLASNEIGKQQSAPTNYTIKDTNMLMDFLHMYPNARFHYYMGTMQLATDSDAAYFVMPEAKTRFVGHSYFESLPHPLNYN